MDENGSFVVLLRLGLQLRTVLREELLSQITLIGISALEDFSLCDLPVSGILSPQKLLEVRLVEDLFAVGVAEGDPTLDAQLGRQLLQQLDEYQKGRTAFTVLEVVQVNGLVPPKKSCASQTSNNPNWGSFSCECFQRKAMRSSVVQRYTKYIFLRMLVLSSSLQPKSDQLRTLPFRTMMQLAATCCKGGFCPLDFSNTRASSQQCLRAQTRSSCCCLSPALKQYILPNLLQWRYADGRW